MTTNGGIIVQQGVSDFLSALQTGSVVELSTVKITSTVLACDGTETDMPNIVWTISNPDIRVSANSITIIVTLDQTVGTFAVGTLGVYTTAGRLFALGAFPGAGLKIAQSPPAVAGNIRVLQLYIPFNNVSDGIAAASSTALVTGPAVLLALQSMTTSLPTSDPLVSGALWNYNGVLCISAG